MMEYLRIIFVSVLALGVGIKLGWHLREIHRLRIEAAKLLAEIEERKDA